MAVDRKSNYQSTQQTFRDPKDGLTKQFTIIDHDKKTKINTNAPLSEGKLAELHKEIKEYKERRIEQILQFPAASASIELYGVFTNRNEQTGVTWNEPAVREACMIDQDGFLDNLRLHLWRKTVQEKYWWDSMSHEDVMAGEWKKLM